MVLSFALMIRNNRLCHPPTDHSGADHRFFVVCPAAGTRPRSLALVIPLARTALDAANYLHRSLGRMNPVIGWQTTENDGLPHRAAEPQPSWRSCSRPTLDRRCCKTGARVTRFSRKEAQSGIADLGTVQWVAPRTYASFLFPLPTRLWKAMLLSLSRFEFSWSSVMVVCFISGRR
jgi:hypothetical protein